MGGRLPTGTQETLVAPRDGQGRPTCIIGETTKSAGGLRPSVVAAWWDSSSQNRDEVVGVRNARTCIARSDLRKSEAPKDSSCANDLHSEQDSSGFECSWIGTTLVFERGGPGPEGIGGRRRSTRARLIPPFAGTAESRQSGVRNARERPQLLSKQLTSSLHSGLGESSWIGWSLDHGPRKRSSIADLAASLSVLDRVTRLHTRPALTGEIPSHTRSVSIR